MSLTIGNIVTRIRDDEMFKLCATALMLCLFNCMFGMFLGFFLMSMLDIVIVLIIYHIYVPWLRGELELPAQLPRANQNIGNSATVIDGRIL
jgi:hypothetical protein